MIGIVIVIVHHISVIVPINKPTGWQTLDPISADDVKLISSAGWQ
jgi:hypothetical protein